MFSDTESGNLRRDWSAPAAVCADCTVTDECLADGKQNNDWWMFRAGTTPLDRLKEAEPRYADRTEQDRSRLYARLLVRKRAAETDARAEHAIWVQQHRAAFRPPEPLPRQPTMTSPSPPELLASEIMAADDCEAFDDGWL